MSNHQPAGGLVQIEERDAVLLADIAASMEEAVRRGSAWIACKPGCTACCLGPFTITALDGIRLQTGMRELEKDDPDRANRIRKRAAEYVERIAPEYPGDVSTGTLLDEDALPEAMDEVPCPALDPETGLCEVYAFRPVTCRTFGPATRVGEESFGACELCYQGATEAEVARCAVGIDPGGLEVQLLRDLGAGANPELTIVAYALGGGNQPGG